MLSDFLELVRTEGEREIMVREIDMVVNANYQVNNTDSLNKTIRAQSLPLFEAARIKEKNFLGFLKSLRQLVLDLPPFELTLAIDPTDELVNEIFSWVSLNVKKPLILSFKKNPNLIGGAEVSYMGNYYSFTLNKVLDEVLLERNSQSLAVNKAQ